MGLDGKVAIVTGGAQGIGRATAHRLARDGASVVIADVQSDKGFSEAEAIGANGGRATFVQADIGDPAQIDAMIAHALATFGRLDILVNNAYQNTPGPADQVTAEAWDRGFAVMVRAMGLAARNAVPAMRAAGGGSIVNIASVHGLLAASNSAIYETCKHAVIGITRAMAVDYGPSGIRVNAICPGLIVTEKHDPAWSSDRAHAVFTEEMYPLRRAGRPSDIANAIAFLVSEDATFITGHALTVDGGLSVQLQDSLAYRMRTHMESDNSNRPLHTPTLPS